MKTEKMGVFGSPIIQGVQGCKYHVQYSLHKTSKFMFIQLSIIMNAESIWNKALKSCKYFTTSKALSLTPGLIHFTFMHLLTLQFC